MSDLYKLKDQISKEILVTYDEDLHAELIKKLDDVNMTILRNYFK